MARKAVHADRLVLAIASVGAGLIAMAASGLPSLLPTPSLLESKRTRSPEAAVGQAVSLEVAAADTSVSLVIVYGSCASCSVASPSDLRHRLFTVPTAVVVSGRPSAETVAGWDLPKAVHLIVDESESQLPKALYQSAPIAAFIRDSRVERVVPVSVALQEISRGSH